LHSHQPRTEKGYPLLIEPNRVVVEESPVNLSMLQTLLPKLDYSAIVQAARQLATYEDANEAFTVPDLPDLLPETLDDLFLTALYKFLFDLHVIEGHLVCPDTGRKFPIKEGVPNMILHEDEL